MGKKIYPFLLRTGYYPNYKFFTKVPFTLSKNQFNNSKIILDVYSSLRKLEIKFIILDSKVILLNSKTILIYIILPSKKNSNLNSTLLSHSKQEKNNLLIEINNILSKLNFKYKNNYSFKIDIINSTKYFNYQKYLFYWIKFLMKKIFSFKVIFNKLVEELSILSYNKSFLYYGIKLKISGRINGSELAKIETFKKGTVPLHTIINNIQYDNYFIKTNFGLLGIKIWLFIY
uniref:30S ribosomal protein S3 n=1 Tax=Nephromyces sp. ex Molgula occidentalis TaxID=2544991 RepID=A0A5C1H8J8_9APIC|nr:30S ribosomal protein S3 [Nephromyces sp. ex Molgula occidentalis]